MICPIKHFNPSLNLQQGHTYIALERHNAYTGSLEARVKASNKELVYVLVRPNAYIEDYCKLGQIIKKEKGKEITILFNPTDMLHDHGDNHGT